MIIKTAEFVKSSAQLDQCPESKLPEYAFIGRSNVGKSSLINMLTGHTKLAMTIFFSLNNNVIYIFFFYFFCDVLYFDVFCYFVIN